MFSTCPFVGACVRSQGEHSPTCSRQSVDCEIYSETVDISMSGRAHEFFSSSQRRLLRPEVIFTTDQSY